MGIGDELMCAGEARRRATLAPGTRYLMLDKFGEPKWHPIWSGNPHIAQPGEPHDGTIGYVNGTRAYIASLTKQRYTFREYKPHPAVIELPERSKQMASRAAGCVVFNPTVKPRAPVNKQWPRDYWRKLIAQHQDVRWLQAGEAGHRIAGAEYVQTADVFDALALLSGAAAVVCHEGALHHAAAAFNVPAVVIRGGFISSRVTGYDGQADLYIEDELYPLGCGIRVPCPHCHNAMESIGPDAVMAALRSVLRECVAA